VTALALVAGLLFLVAGAELLVRGASRLALVLRIPPLIIGLTVVAFGTSAPELAVSTSAALAGTPDIAIGNVVGSNIFNVLIILGLAAVVAPLTVSSRLVRLDVPVMIGISFVLLLMSWDGQVSRLDGVILLAGMIGYLAYLFRSGGSADLAVPGEGASGDAAPGQAATEPRGARGYVVDAALIAIGLVLLVVGSDWLVDSARTIATGLGVSELMIGLTIVAAGTSLPELATSVMATIRGQRDIAVGNVVGSNIFNILAILGITATIAPDGIGVSPAAATFDIPVMVAVAVVCLPVLFTGGIIARWEGALFVAGYIAYTAYLALDSTGHQAFPVYQDALLLVVIPVAAVTLAVSLFHSLRRTRG